MLGFAAKKDEKVAPVDTDAGDHEKFAHYVEAEKLTDAHVFGTPVQALCGKMWVPTRDPEKFPVCPECKDAYDNLKED